MTGPIVVTGVGMVTAAGDQPAAVLAAVSAGAPLAVTHSEEGIAVRPIPAFDVTRYITKKGVKDLSRASQLACAASAANARMLDGVAADQVGVVFGSAWGAVATVIDFEREAHLQGARFVDPILFTETVSNVPAGQVAIFHGWSAFNVTVSSGSASGLDSLRHALAFLAEDRGTVAVAGGGDEINRRVLRALDPRCRPAGGEGACFLTLEPLAHARRRGAAALAEVRASGARFVPGVTTDAAAGRESMSALIREVLDAAELHTDAIDLVVLSASGLDPGDSEEAGAVSDVFGTLPKAPSTLAPKAVLGETWGASGVLAAACAIEILQRSPGPRARNALILDRTDAGHQLGLVISSMEPHDDRR